MKLDNISPEFAADLIGLVNSLKGLTKGSEVNSGKFSFKYITLDSILDKVKENNNFAVIQPLGTDEQGESAVQTILIHKGGGSLVSDYYKLRVPENGTKQQEGSAITYTKRYALGAFLGICTEEDDDSNTANGGMTYGRTSSAQAQKPTQTQKATGEKTISDAQAKRMFALAEGDKEIVRKVLDMTGYAHSKDIKVSDYEDICTTIKSMVAQAKAAKQEYPGFNVDDIEF